MTQQNWQHRLCLMLAFQTVVAHGKPSEGMAEKVIELARRMNEFSELNLSKAFPSDNPLDEKLEETDAGTRQ
ncbi:MAG: hypothetical protein PHD48_12775 [Alphaproteobacteria bacterium]|nr:hypothetical protein [Alphaproteobacteria bacterium]